VAQKFREDEATSMLADYTEKCADQLDRLSDYLKQKDLRSLFDDAQTMARRHPELFFGALFFGGLALARFLKASAKPRYRVEEEYSQWQANEQPFGEPAMSVYGSGGMGFQENQSRKVGDTGFAAATGANAGVSPLDRGSTPGGAQSSSFSETQSGSMCDVPQSFAGLRNESGDASAEDTGGEEVGTWTSGVHESPANRSRRASGGPA
jgi:hypothetical protein